MSWLLLTLGAALAQQPDEPEVRAAPALDAALHGDLKSFLVASFPYDHALMPEDASATGILDGRLKLGLTLDNWSAEVHHAVTLLGGAAGLGLAGASTGVGLTAPEALPLTWDVHEGDILVRGRTDRLWVRGRFGGVDATLGRQPVSFGNGRIFTPLDLVAPFHPATVDTEYKPGVDAARVDAYLGTSGRLTAVAAYAGDWTDGMVYALYGQGTVGVTDLGMFGGLVHAEPVVGVTVASSVGPVGLYGDATVTIAVEEGAFVRAVAGADWRPTSTTTLSGEVYVQTFGAADPAEYLVVAQSPRFSRGEVWQLGRTYAALTVAQEITPLIFGSLAVIANVEDPSALIAPGLAWNVASNAELTLGAYVGAGQRPDDPQPPDLSAGAPDPDDVLRGLGVRSEYGIYPPAFFFRVATYF